MKFVRLVLAERPLICLVVESQPDSRVGELEREAEKRLEAGNRKGRESDHKDV